jgi:U32 family peptidase
VSNRGYSLGFMKGGITSDDYETSTHKYRSTSVMVANTTDQMRGDQRVCKVKNTVQAGERLELLTPDGISGYTLPTFLISLDGERLDHANNQDTILLGNDLPPYAVLRRITNS